jgi:diguanylate cyclase (GGDEF)-like protein
MTTKRGLNKRVASRMLYHRFTYIIAFALTIISRFTQNGASTGYVLLVSLVLALIIVSETLIDKYVDEGKFLTVVEKAIGYVLVLFLEYQCQDEMLLFIWVLISMMFGVEYIVTNSSYERNSVDVRKLILSVITFTFVNLTYEYDLAASWVIYLVLRFATVGVIFYIARYILSTYEKCDSQLNVLYTQLSQYESSNNELMEYQQRVKEINEQINYQKIDLTRAYTELEQVNIETRAQADIMKYMTSTFDITKCINVIIDSIMEVKKPKLCAIYLDKNVYDNSEGSCTIKTNYASMQRRLKKDIQQIFAEVAPRDAESEILHGESVKKYRFIGDTNIETMALLPIKSNRKTYGLMIVASDEEGFFDKGLDFYDNCITEFVVSVKTTKLYLKTQDMARKDGLTKIYNRVYFMELFEEAAKTAVRKNQALSVALFDIDKFKSVNDTYGHLAGDKVIKMVAQTGLRYADKYNGFTCRYGGEEFLLVFPGKDEQETLEILEEFHNEIKSTTVPYNEFNIDVNVCIGLSSYPNICKDPELLVNRADVSMYYGKKHGRGRLVLDNPLVDEEE